MVFPVFYILICVYSSDVQCSLEIALWANDVQVNNEQKAGAIVTEELVGSTIGRDILILVVELQHRYRTSVPKY